MIARSFLLARGVDIAAGLTSRARPAGTGCLGLGDDAQTQRGRTNGSVSVFGSCLSGAIAGGITAIVSTAPASLIGGLTVELND
jgi:hypothetical protein